jgi:phage terminase large subunit
MKTELKISPKIFNKVYLPYVLDYSHRVNLYIGSAGSGKSVFVVQKILIKALNEKRRVLLVRKVARTLKNTIFQQVLDTLAFFQVLDMCKVNKSDYHIELPNGSVLLFSGLDDSEKLKSLVNISDIVIEEASEITLDDFSQLDIRLRSPLKNNQIYLMTNPISKANWVYKYFYENKNLPDTFILHTTYKDNRFLKPEYIRSLENLQHTNPTYYRIYALGEFGALNQKVFTNYRIGEPPAHAEKLQRIVGLDFGYTVDPTTIIVSLVDTKNKKLYIIDELYEKGLLNDAIAKAIQIMELSAEIIIADSAEQKSIDEIKRYGIPRIRPSIKGPGSVQFGIQKLQQYEVIISSRCPRTFEEFENYTYKKDRSTGEYTNQPEDAFNHCIDALRYSLQIVEGKPQLRTTTKQSLGL